MEEAFADTTLFASQPDSDESRLSVKLLEGEEGKGDFFR